MKVAAATTILALLAATGDANASMRGASVTHGTHSQLPAEVKAEKIAELEGFVSELRTDHDLLQKKINEIEALNNDGWFDVSPEPVPEAKSEPQTGTPPKIVRNHVEPESKLPVIVPETHMNITPEMAKKIASHYNLKPLMGKFKLTPEMAKEMIEKYKLTPEMAKKIASRYGGNVIASALTSALSELSGATPPAEGKQSEPAPKAESKPQKVSMVPTPPKPAHKAHKAHKASRKPAHMAKKKKSDINYALHKHIYHVMPVLAKNIATAVSEVVKNAEQKDSNPAVVAQAVERAALNAGASKVVAKTAAKKALTRFQAFRRQRAEEASKPVYIPLPTQSKPAHPSWDALPVFH